MASQARLHLPGCPLHIIQRGHLRQPCFFHRSDYLVYLDCVREYSRFNGVATHAYVLMTNHIHLLVSADDVMPISAMMKGVSQKYTQYLNRRFERKGTWWEGRFRSSPVPVDRYALICQRYIELNPVRAAMVSSADEYRWSSYAGNAGVQPDDLLTPHSVYLDLSKLTAARHEIYRQLLSVPISPDHLQAIRQAVIGNHPVGLPPDTRRKSKTPASEPGKFPEFGI
ncbi:transposase [Pseudoduganella dura]|nr:transposase [Pseudoduganella dura]